MSVVIAANNASSYIQAAVESILNQTLTDLECIVIDDGSIDQTLEVLADNTDPRLRTFQLPINCGIAAAT
ncbi:MAG: glycosyltransferase family 2 protein, partial [Porticoccaceae bacterium]